MLLETAPTQAEVDRERQFRAKLDHNGIPRPRLNKYIPQIPEFPQARFLNLTCKEALYGGAAGGGKSSALLMAALQYVDVPGYSAIIFRRTYQDLSLPDALIPRSHEWLRGTDAAWDRETHTWKFPSGAKLTFGYCDTVGGEYRYQGMAVQFIGWDELTQFEEHIYTYLFSRLRTLAAVDVPLRVRGATNPGGIGHRWVKRRFIDPLTRDPDAPYIPAKVSDNPHLRSDYTDSLSYLDPVTRARYLEGDWTVIDDNRFVYPFERGVHVRELPADTQLRLVVGGIDPGTRDPYAVGVWGLDWDGRWWGLRELYQLGSTSVSMAPAIRALQDEYKVRCWFVDKRRPSDILDLQAAGVTALPNLDVHYETSRDTIRPMIGTVLDLFHAGKIFFSGSMKWHIQEAEDYQYRDADAKNAGEVPLDKSNHAMDEMRYAICSVEEGAVPGIKLNRPRGEKILPIRRPGEKAKIPSMQDYLNAGDKEEAKLLRGNGNGNGHVV